MGGVVESLIVLFMSHLQSSAQGEKEREKETPVCFGWREVLTINLAFHKTPSQSQQDSFQSDISIKQRLCRRPCQRNKGRYIRVDYDRHEFYRWDTFLQFHDSRLLPIKLLFDSWRVQSKGARWGRMVCIFGPILAGAAWYISTPLSLSSLCSP